MREGRKRFPAGPRKARPGKGDQFPIGELIWVAGAGIGEEWRRRCDSHHTATPQLGGSPVRRGITVQAASAPRPRSSRAFDCLADAQDRAACHKPATPPISVRAERSRDTHRPCAALTGVSTALDTNGTMGHAASSVRHAERVSASMAGPSLFRRLSDEGGPWPPGSAPGQALKQVGTYVLQASQELFPGESRGPCGAALCHLDPGFRRGTVPCRGIIARQVRVTEKRNRAEIRIPTGLRVRAH